MLENLIFAIVLSATMINLGVQLYIHYEAYPLFNYVGKGEYKTYLTEYENRLMMPLVAPYIVTILSNIALIFLRPDDVPVIGVIVLLVLNLAVSTVTLTLATPVYNRIKAGDSPNSADMSSLMNINLIRLVLSALASLVALGLLVNLLDK